MKPLLKLNVKEDGTGDLHDHWDSLAELKDWLFEGDGRREVVEADKKSFASIVHVNSSENNAASDSWDLKAGWAGAVAMATGGGWEAGAERIRRILEGIESYAPEVEEEANTQAFTFEYGEEGDEFDVGALLSGDDRPWLETKFEATKPIVRILCDIGASAGVSAEAMLGRGCVMAAVASKLERLGFGVQLFIGFNGNGYGGGVTKTHACTVRVKDSDERVDEGILAFWLAHPAAFRRLCFRMIEASHADWLGCGYGTPRQLDSDDFDLISPSAHLNRAQREGWGNNPDTAAKATLALVNEVLAGRLAKITDEISMGGGEG